MVVTYISIYLIGEVISSGSGPCKNQCFVKKKYLQFLRIKYSLVDENVHSELLNTGWRLFRMNTGGQPTNCFKHMYYIKTTLIEQPLTQQVYILT